MVQPNWVEWEGPVPPLLDLGSVTLVLTSLGHPESVELLRDSLVQEYARSGVAESMSVAYQMAARTVLTYGWYGFIDDDTEQVWCDGAGLALTEDRVDRALPCVYAVLVL